jgi:hypothetical protein
MLASVAGLDALVLSNPWTVVQDDAPLAPEAIRDHSSADWPIRRRSGDV